MTQQFIEKLAEARAKELFTKQFYVNCSDSWYYDEWFEFEEKKIGVEARKPTQEEVEIYMAKLNRLFDDYEDIHFGEKYVKIAYKDYARNISNLLEEIEVDKIRYSKLSIDEDIMKKLVEIKEYFEAKL